MGNQDLHQRNQLISLLLLLLLPLSISDDGCSFPPEKQLLRSDRLTVVLSGHSPHRIPLLRRIALSYSAHPLISSVLILWSNPTTPRHHLESLFGMNSISLEFTPTTSLNSRFFPHKSIQTLGVIIADDDIEPNHKAITFAFNIWLQKQPSLVGFFARSHAFDFEAKKWVYVSSEPERRYSIILTKFMVVSVELMYKYSCSLELEPARKHVDEVRNCEDILMNFVTAMEFSGASRPVLVEAGSVRDWGDPRNDDTIENNEKELKGVMVKDAGLSARGVEHWRKRGECITKFHQILRRMPLRYSYGKVVEATGEQGLCWKGGKIVPCDQDG